MIWLGVSAVEADDGVLPEAADSEVPIEPTSESSVDSSEASSVDLLDSVADAVAVEGVSTDEDISAPSSSLDETEQASVSLDTTVHPTLKLTHLKVPRYGLGPTTACGCSISGYRAIRLGGHS